MDSAFSQINHNSDLQPAYIEVTTDNFIHVLESLTEVINKGQNTINGIDAVLEAFNNEPEANVLTRAKATITMLGLNSKEHVSSNTIIKTLVRSRYILPQDTSSLAQFFSRTDWNFEVFLTGMITEPSKIQSLDQAREILTTDRYLIDMCVISSRRQLLRMERLLDNIIIDRNLSPNAGQMLPNGYRNNRIKQQEVRTYDHIAFSHSLAERFKASF